MDARTRRAELKRSIYAELHRKLQSDLRHADYLCEDPATGEALSAREEQVMRSVANEVLDWLDDLRRGRRVI